MPTLRHVMNLVAHLWTLRPQDLCCHTCPREDCKRRSLWSPLWSSQLTPHRPPLFPKIEVCGSENLKRFSILVLCVSVPVSVPQLALFRRPNVGLACSLRVIGGIAVISSSNVEQGPWCNILPVDQVKKAVMIISGLLCHPTGSCFWDPRRL